MTAKLLLVGSLGVLFCVGFIIIRESFPRVVELELEGVPQPEREDEILRAFFPGEFAQRAIAHLALYDLQSFEEVMQPRPQISMVVERFGPADSVAEEDLSPFGVSERGEVHYYGRLGLVTPARRTDHGIFWIPKAERRPGSLGHR